MASTAWRRRSLFPHLSEQYKVGFMGGLVGLEFSLSLFFSFFYLVGFLKQTSRSGMTEVSCHGRYGGKPLIFRYWNTDIGNSLGKKKTWVVVFVGHLHALVRMAWFDIPDI